MVRVDVWDVQNPEDFGPIDCGFPRELDTRYTFGKVLGKGGFGTVGIVVENSTGREYACKTIGKRLDVPNFSPQKQAAHLDNVKREIAVLRRLQGTLNVAQLKEALEDEESVHIVMEYCKGGELWNYIGKLQHYSERTVASYMRAVLRTVAQCHSHHILHRDIKPSNFMLLEESPFSPVKAIDFGMAVFFEPGKLPRRDLGLEGTPWFMSPETLSSQVGPPSDVWAAGIMAYQLLSGYLPFDDHKNREAPALSKVWKAILTEEVVFKGKAWLQVSTPAKDFVLFILNKDPSKRPTAKAALQHKWLVGGHKDERTKGVPLRHTVVQRIQKFGQGNILKRTIFELIAQEIIKMAPETPEPSSHGRATTPPVASTSGKGEGDDSQQASMRAAQLISSIKRRKSHRALAALAHGPGGGAMEGPPLLHRDHHSVHGGMEYYKARGESVHNGQQALESLCQEGRPTSVHGSQGYWRAMRAAATALKSRNGSVPGRNSYLRYMPKCAAEREEQRKAARLALDTSTRGTPEYQNFLKQCSSPNWRRRESDDGGGAESSGREQATPAASDVGCEGARNIFPVSDSPPGKGAEEVEQRVRGRHAYRQFLMEQNQRGVLDDVRKLPSPDVRNRSHSFSELANATQHSQRPDKRPRDEGGAPHFVDAPDAAGEVRMPRTLTNPAHNAGTLTQLKQGDCTAEKQGSSQELQKQAARKSVSFQDELPDRALESGNHSRGSSRDLSTVAGTVGEMKDLMRKLNFTREAEGVSEEELEAGLRQLGYQLQPDEMRILAKQMDPHAHSGAVSKSAFLASQIDWYDEDDDVRELWMEAAKKVFADLEKCGDGKLSSTALMAMVREKVPEAEVEYAIEDALVEAGYANEEEMDFDGFLRILRADSTASLDTFEARLPATASQDSLALPSSPPQTLSTVAEES